MCRRCLAEATRTMMFVIANLAPEEREFAAVFVVDNLEDLDALGYDFDALEAKIHTEVNGQVIIGG
jgi:hypothetical protein